MSYNPLRKCPAFSGAPGSFGLSIPVLLVRPGSRSSLFLCRGAQHEGLSQPALRPAPDLPLVLLQLIEAVGDEGMVQGRFLVGELSSRSSVWMMSPSTSTTARSMMFSQFPDIARELVPSQHGQASDAIPRMSPSPLRFPNFWIKCRVSREISPFLSLRGGSSIGMILRRK